MSMSMTMMIKMMIKMMWTQRYLRESDISPQNERGAGGSPPIRVAQPSVRFLKHRYCYCYCYCYCCWYCRYDNSMVTAMARVLVMHAKSMERTKAKEPQYFSIFHRWLSLNSLPVQLLMHSAVSLLSSPSSSTSSSSSWLVLQRHVGQVEIGAEPALKRILMRLEETSHHYMSMAMMMMMMSRRKKRKKRKKMGEMVKRFLSPSVMVLLI